MPSLVNGLGGTAGFGEGTLARNDDRSTPAIDIRPIFGSAGLNFFGTNYTSLYVNNNGNLTFRGPLSEYIAAPIGGGGLTQPIIAAYWFDVDTRGGIDTRSPGGTSTGSNLVYFDLDATNRIFTATWDDVGYFSRHIGSPNAFQIRLIDMGSGNFDIEFIYEVINQSYSDTNVDPGEAPRAGYSAGTGTGVEIANSGDFVQVLQLDTAPGNTGVAGYWLFQVRSGLVLGGAGGSGPVIDPPRPIDFSVETIGLRREGDSGTTPFDVVIRRGGGDLSVESVVQWRIVIDDPRDLAPGQPLSGTVTFGAGQAAITVPINVVGDRVFELDDMIRFQLVEVTYGSLTWSPGIEAAAIIVNDDPATSYDFTGAQVRAEGQSGVTAFDFVVLRTGDVTAASSVEWRLDVGSADALDLAPGQAMTGVINFGPGQTQATIQINVAGDTRPELDEDFTVRLTQATTRTSVSPLTASATGTILDDDLRQTLLVGSPTAIAVLEGDAGPTAFDFTLLRIGDLSTSVDLPYVISLPSTGGLSRDELLTPLSGTLSFAAGASSATLTVLVQGDTRPEGTETFLVTVGGGAGLNTLVLTGVVLNDDKVATSIAQSPAFNGASSLGETSDFLQNLLGGTLWSNASVF